MLFEFIYQRAQPLHVAKLIKLAMDKQYRLPAHLHESKVIFIERRAYAYQVLNSFVGHANLKSYPRAKRKAAYCNILTQIFLRQVRYSCSNIVKLAFTVIVN